MQQILIAALLLLPLSLEAQTAAAPGGGSLSASPQAAVSGCAKSGIVTLSGTLETSTPLIIPSNCHVVIPSGSILRASGNVPLIQETSVNNVIIDGGGIIDGQHRERSYSSNCFTLRGATNIVIRDLTIRNCGDSGIYGTAITNGKIHNNVFIGIDGDPVHFQDAIAGLEIYGNSYDTTGSRVGAHCVGVYSTQNTGAGVAGINIHDEIANAGQTNPCFEIGYFGSGRPIPDWPTRISVSRIRVTQTGPRGSMAVSLSNAHYAVVDDISVDYRGANGNFSVEVADSSRIEVSHIVETNAAANRWESIALNESSWVDLHDFYVEGQIHVYNGPQPSTGEPTSSSHGTVHDGKIRLQPSFPNKRGPIWIQQNLASTGSIQDWDFHDLQITGLGPSDQLNCFSLENDQPSTTFDGIKIHDNTCENIQYGFQNVTNSPYMSNVLIGDNILGDRVREYGTFRFFGSRFQVTNFGNPHTDNLAPFVGPGFSASGAPPTCMAGTGAGTGASCTVVAATQWHGLVYVTTGSNPVPGGQVLTLTMPTAYATRPYCTWSDGGNAADITLLYFDRSDSTTTKAVWANSAVGALGRRGTVYSIIYDCPLTPY